MRKPVSRASWWDDSALIAEVNPTIVAGVFGSIEGGGDRDGRLVGAEEDWRTSSGTS